MSFDKHPEIRVANNVISSEASNVSAHVISSEASNASTHVISSEASNASTHVISGEARSAESRNLESLNNAALKCKACPLWEGRTHVVFGAGSPSARVMVVGEAPGRNEDEAGVPFVGAAGKNLDALLALAGLSREDVYIANVLKCRPPENRNPRVEEIQACAHFLHEQARLVAPDIIVTLGNFATRHIMKTDCGITDVRGRVHEVGRFCVFPVFHPAAALYDRKKQQVLEEDFVALGQLLRA